jgi:RNase P subunit RPR2
VEEVVVGGLAAPICEIKGRDMSKEAMRAEADRLIKEAMEKKSVTIKQGDTRIEATCGKCGAKNRVSAAQGQLRVPFTCKECGHKQATL